MPLWGSSKGQAIPQSDKWAPLAPSAPSTSRHGGALFGSVLKPSKPTIASTAQGPMIGRYPETVILRILDYLPVPDLPAMARVSRAFGRIVRDERGWEARCRFLRLEVSPVAEAAPVAIPGPGSNVPSGAPNGSVGKATPKLPTPRKSTHKREMSMDDDFGDFNNNSEVFEDVDFGDFGPKATNGGMSMKPIEKSLLDFDDVPLPSRPAASGAGRTTGFFAFTPTTTARMAPAALGPYYQAYKTHHLGLLPLCRHLRSSPSPSSTLALLFPPSPTTSLPPSLSEQADKLLILLLFLSPRLQPLRDWGFLRQALLSAADRFDSTCLVSFETADGRQDEEGMRIAAESSWKVWEAGGGSRDQWECGRVWVEKREVFYETGKWDSLENIAKVQTGGATVRSLDFTPMDSFIHHVLETFRTDAELAVRVFPPQARVVLLFADRVSTDVIGEYVSPLLSQARATSQDLYLQATAASFVQAWKLVDVAIQVLGTQTAISRSKIEDVIYRMFEVNMDEYLDEETEAVKNVLEGICRQWEQHLGQERSGAAAPNAPTFLTAANPDQVKRNVLAGFKDVLLLPVTIVPRTVTFGVNAIVSGSSHAVNGLSMLNPAKWTGSASAPERIAVKADGLVPAVPSANDDLDEKIEEKATLEVPSVPSFPSGLSAQASRNGSAAPSPSPEKAAGKSFDRLQLLVSLDTALELIHADRDSLKRCETFAKYPGRYGVKVREAIEEIFILMLKAAGDRHIAPGFRIAQNAMSTYQPAEHEETTSVAPLLQFFELVHVGDTIQSMVQVYFDKELGGYVDKTDFLNSVMREKKRFESVLDDAVAAGLNAGIEVLMNQVEHIIQVKTGPREYYPEAGAALDLGPTEGCKEAIQCLEMHCNLLRGSTSKEVLEVFYQEVGIRLQAILQRHLKRQIISLEGGFQIIADLNAYHAFVASLKQQRITDDFANLKMLGHVYIVGDAKDLAQIVRDVTRYGGTFRPEDIYEFIQRRADWKKIEKTVDKAMYALSVKDDCVIM